MATCASNLNQSPSNTKGEKMLLPEIGVALNRNHYACWGADTLEEALPRMCPVCGAKLKTTKKALRSTIPSPIKYVCGAEYKEKPQGQTHTEVYWGVCPARAEPWTCDSAGMAHDTPPGLVADKLNDMGLLEAEASVRRQCKV